MRVSLSKTASTNTTTKDSSFSAATDPSITKHECLESRDDRSSGEDCSSEAGGSRLSCSIDGYSVTSEVMYDSEDERNLPYFIRSVSCDTTGTHEGREMKLLFRHNLAECSWDLRGDVELLRGRSSSRVRLGQKLDCNSEAGGSEQSCSIDSHVESQIGLEVVIYDSEDESVSSTVCVKPVVHKWGSNCHSVVAYDSDDESVSSSMCVKPVVHKGSVGDSVVTYDSEDESVTSSMCVKSAVGKERSGSKIDSVASPLNRSMSTESEYQVSIEPILKFDDDGSIVSSVRMWELLGLPIEGLAELKRSLSTESETGESRHSKGIESCLGSQCGQEVTLFNEEESESAVQNSGVSGKKKRGVLLGCSMMSKVRSNMTMRRRKKKNKRLFGLRLPIIAEDCEPESGASDFSLEAAMLEPEEKSNPCTYAEYPITNDVVNKALPTLDHGSKVTPFVRSQSGVIAGGAVAKHRIIDNTVQESEKSGQMEKFQTITFNENRLKGDILPSTKCQKNSIAKKLEGKLFLSSRSRSGVTLGDTLDTRSTINNGETGNRTEDAKSTSLIPSEGKSIGIVKTRSSQRGEPLKLEVKTLCRSRSTPNQRRCPSINDPVELEKDILEPPTLKPFFRSRSGVTSGGTSTTESSMNNMLGSSVRKDKTIVPKKYEATGLDTKSLNNVRPSLKLEKWVHSFTRFMKMTPSVSASAKEMKNSGSISVSQVEAYLAGLIAEEAVKKCLEELSNEHEVVGQEKIWQC